MAGHNRCSIYQPCFGYGRTEGKEADKGKNSGTHHHTCLTSPLGTGYKLVRVLKEREVNIVGYVPRQLGHGMGTKFPKEVPDNCILAHRAVEKRAEILGRPRNSTKYYDFS